MDTRKMMEAWEEASQGVESFDTLTGFEQRIMRESFILGYMRGQLARNDEIAAELKRRLEEL